MTQEQEQQFVEMLSARVVSDTEHVLAAFNTYAGLKSHTDAKGQVTATDEDILTWSNEHLRANKTLNEEEQKVLGAMASDELPEEEAEKLLELVGAGLGVHDVQLVIIATTFCEASIAMSNALTPAGQVILKGLAEGYSEELQTAAA
jgi:hypothetical protein